MKKIFQLLISPLRIIRYGFARFEEDEHQKICLTKHGKKQLPTIDLLSIASEREVLIEPFSFLDGTSLITDIFLLKTLARKVENCNYLEIGSWRGESIANVAKVAKQCTSITLSDDEMRAMNFGEKFIENHGIFSKGVSNIKTHKANSHNFNFDSLGEKYDLIFVDGDHSYAGVLNDTRKVFNLRRDANSFIVWHDYGNTAESVRYSVLNAILDGIPNEKHKNLYHVSNTMCAIYSEVDLPENYMTEFPTKANKTFAVKVSMKEIKA